MTSVMKMRNVNADAVGKRLNALVIWLGYFLIAAKTIIYSRKRMPRILK